MSDRVFQIALTDIIVDRTLQGKQRLDEDYLQRLLRLVLAGFDLDPVMLFGANGRYWLADGFGRRSVYERAERSSIPAIVRPGGYREAKRYSLAANSRHGKPRSTVEEKAAIYEALKDEEWGKLSDEELIAICGSTPDLFRQTKLDYQRQLPLFEGPSGTVDDSEFGKADEDAPDDEPEAKPAKKTRRIACEECEGTGSVTCGACGGKGVKTKG